MPFGDSTNQVPIPRLGQSEEELQRLIAPYQQQMQQFQTPYAALGRGLPAPQLPGFLQHIPGIGSLSQNINERLQSAMPGINAHLDNAFLAAAMTPQAQGPEGVGGGISRTMQGLVGAQQYRLERAMKMAMMPYQMMMPRLQAQNLISQEQERRAMIPYYLGRGESYEKTYETQQRRADIEQQKANAPRAVGAPYASDQGVMHQDVIDPTTGRVTQQPVGQAPTSPQTFLKRAKGTTPAGSYEEQIENMRLSPDPAIKAEGERRWQDHMAALGTAAGTRTAATKAAEQPYMDKAAMIAYEKDPRRLYDDLVNPRNPEMEKWVNTPGLETMPEVQKYIQSKKDYQSQVVKRDTDFGKYSSSTAPEQGIHFKEYQDNPDLYPQKNKTRADLPRGDNRPATSGTNLRGRWNSTTQSYDTTDTGTSNPQWKPKP